MLYRSHIALTIAMCAVSLKKFDAIPAKLANSPYVNLVYTASEVKAPVMVADFFGGTAYMAL